MSGLARFALNFFSTLAAILVAAAIIYGIKSCAEESRLNAIREQNRGISHDAWLHSPAPARKP